MAMVVATSAFAQLNFGVKVGGNLATISGVKENLGTFDHDYGTASKIETTQAMKLGANVGVWAEYMVMPMLGVQVELNYSMQGVKANSTWSMDNILISTSTSTDYTWSANYITVPILAKAHFANLAAYFGPQLGFNAGFNTTTSTTSGDTTKITNEAVEDEYNGLDISLVVGGQYKLTKNIGIDARYNIGLTNLFPATTNDKGEVLTEAWGKQGVIQLGVFYEF